MDIKRNVILSDYTSIRLGGAADQFIICRTVGDIVRALEFTGEKQLPVCVLAGGSNLIFRDEGYKGAVLKINLKGVNVYDEGDSFLIKVAAGENWDDLIRQTIELGLTGIECLSGIPGATGATPVQNVGAYGQEVSDIIENVYAIDRSTLKKIIFTKEDCRFGYRQSRFKNDDKDKYIITEVTYRFKKNEKPVIKYDQLKEYLEGQYSDGNSIADPEKIRNSVLELRRSKSMVLDPDDPDSRSCGSFFMNPVLNEFHFREFMDRLPAEHSAIKFFKTDGQYKIPAAWLIEKAGFKKGYMKNGVGISRKHSLALININGTTNALMKLAAEIVDEVRKKFGIELEREPVYVQ